MDEKGTKNPDAAAWAAALKHRPSYSKSLADYSATFGVKERGMKKWIERARELWIAHGCPVGGPDFPPLDEPARMLAWWQANMTNTPSTKLLELAGTSPDALAAQKATAKAASAPPAEASPPSRAAVNIDDYQSMSFAEAVRRQGRYVAAAMFAYDTAAAKGVPVSELTLLAKERDNALDQLRTCQRDFDKAEIERGERVHLTDLREELAPLLSHLASSFIELLVSRVGLPRARARALADEWFADLRASRFAADATPAPAVPSTAAA